MANSLWDWVQNELTTDGGRYVNRARLGYLERSAEVVVGRYVHVRTQLDEIRAVLERDDEKYLDAVDFLVSISSSRGNVTHLTRILNESALGARRLIAARRREAELASEKAARRSEKLATPHRVGGGVPAIEGASPFESMVAAGGVVMPSEEFAGGRPKPRFLEEEIEAGEKHLAEKKREAEAKSKERLVAQMQDQLGRLKP